ncbi:amino acid ABC transporter permease [Bartonella sp. HY038]|uniref:amino acid ABC transporter permease n=1 Tax=Bartonella sp. HY038 TaxID=2759660 RepID=UPI0015FE13CC|nr:amino acid ABC transporter permease [Bartonella sp. HY038]
MFFGKLSWNDILYMANGALVTIELTALAMLIGTIIGVFCGFLRAGAPTLSAPLSWFLDITRSVPLLIQFVVFNSFKSVIGLNWSAFTIACIVLGLYAASYCTEIVRSGVLAVPSSLRRASRSLGLSWWQDIIYIVLPLATRISFPGWLNLTLSVMKDTALVFWIGIVELLRTAQQVNVRLNEPLLIFFIAGIFYYIISWVVSRIGAHFEKKWGAA